MATQPNDTDIGVFRKIRLKTNAKGYWEIWWTDATNNAYLTKRESCRTKVFAEAQTYLDNFIDSARQTEIAVVQARLPSVDELCRRWLLHVEPMGKSDTGKYVLKGPRSLLGRYTADQLDGNTLGDYAHQRGLAAGTIRRELSALRTVLIWAADMDFISQDDIPRFKKVIPSEGDPRIKFLDPGQEQWFWDQAMKWGDGATWKDPLGLEAQAARRVMLFVALGLETSARRGAILDLEWDRVDLSLGAIDYRKPGARLTKKRRVQGLPISDRLLPVLKEAWLRAPKDASGRAVGRVVGSSDIGRPFKRFATAIGMGWVTPHVLRHTWASLAAMNGVPLLTVARVMGDTVATVEAYYAHLSPGHLRAAINHKSGNAPAARSA